MRVSHEGAGRSRSTRLTRGVALTALALLATPAALALRVASAAEAPTAAAPAQSPIGLWKTFDDRTGQARAIVRIYEENGRLFGRLEQSFRPGAERRICDVCSDERHDQPIIGLLVIRNLRPTGGEWSGGDILDPDSGWVYRCKMRLEAHATHLIVRGYIGFSLLGRSQTWERQTAL